MDLILVIKALVLGIVEGLTEFLPVSSTGHLIVVGSLLQFNDERGKLFEIVIQFGAILAVCWEYRAKLIHVLTSLPREEAARRFVVNLAVAFVPAARLGLLFHKAIKAVLFNALPVALAFIVGALIILWVERRERAPRVSDVDDLSWLDALKLGLAQCFALIPGTSRSGATIIGGMLFGLSRKAATEFSFFLAIPTLFAATAFELFKARHALAGNDWSLIGAGFVAAFVSAFIAVRALLRYIATHDFKPFAWYRIAFGLIVLATAYFGWVDWRD